MSSRPESNPGMAIAHLSPGAARSIAIAHALPSPLAVHAAPSYFPFARGPVRHTRTITRYATTPETPPVSATAPIVVDAKFIASAEDLLDLPAPVFAEVAIAGKSNVGKSSLINTLCGRRKLAHTSSTPGRTQRLNLLRVELRGGSLDLIDLPGYGYAKVSKAERRAWGPMIERFLQQRTGLRGVVVILDIRRGFQPEDRQLLEFLAEHQRPVLLVATKIDKLTHASIGPALESVRKQSGARVLPFSAVTRDGRDQLWQALLEMAGLRLDEPPRPAAAQADAPHKPARRRSTKRKAT